MTHALTISAFTTLTSFIIILNDAGRSHVHGYSPGYNNNNHRHHRCRHHRCRHPTIMSRASLSRANSHDCESLLTHQSSNSQLSRRKSHPSRRGGGGRAKYYYGQVKKDEDYFIHHRLHMRAGNDLNLGSIGGDDSCSTPARKIGSGVGLDAANSSGSPNGGSSIGNVIIGRQDGKRRQAARTVASFFSSFPLLSKSTDATASTKNSRVTVLEQENEILRQTISALEKENQILEKASQTRQRIIVEQFEGEGKPMFDVNGAPIDPTWWEEGEKPIGLRSTSGVLSNETATDNMSSTEEFTSLVGREVNTGASSAVSVVADADECDDYDDGICPVEPDISFKDALKDRAYWLVGLLTLQSMSGFILARNEQLLQTHPVIVYFLTMLVGAGGNAGNQAAVRGKCYAMHVKILCKHDVCIYISIMMVTLKYNSKSYTFFSKIKTT